MTSGSHTTLRDTTDQIDSPHASSARPAPTPRRSRRRWVLAVVLVVVVGYE